MNKTIRILTALAALLLLGVTAVAFASCDKTPETPADTTVEDTTPEATPAPTGYMVPVESAVPMVRMDVFPPLPPEADAPSPPPPQPESSPSAVAVTKSVAKIRFIISAPFPQNQAVSGPQAPGTPVPRIFIYACCLGI